MTLGWAGVSGRRENILKKQGEILNLMTLGPGGYYSKNLVGV
jgi:hypothetical protein